MTKPCRRRRDHHLQLYRACGSNLCAGLCHPSLWSKHDALILVVEHEVCTLCLSCQSITTRTLWRRPACILLASSTSTVHSAASSSLAARIYSSWASSKPRSSFGTPTANPYLAIEEVLTYIVLFASPFGNHCEHLGRSTGLFGWCAHCHDGSDTTDR